MSEAPHKVLSGGSEGSASSDIQSELRSKISQLEMQLMHCNQRSSLLEKEQKDTRERKERDEKRRDFVRSDSWSEEKILRIQSELSVPPCRHSIKGRVGHGSKFYEYLSGSVIIDNLNSVFGFNGWRDEYINTESKVIYTPANNPKGSNNFFVSAFDTCIITLRDGTRHEDSGDGSAEMGCLHSCIAKAKKQAKTDALKRAARKFGAFLGNNLYMDEGGKKFAPQDEASRQEMVSKQIDENRDAYQDKAVVKTEKTTVKSENYAYQDYPKSYDAEAQQMASSCVYSPRPQAPPSQAMDQKQYIENTSFAGNHGVASSSSSSWCQGGQKRVNTPSNAAVQKNLNPYKKFKATTTTPN